MKKTKYAPLLFSIIALLSCKKENKTSGSEDNPFQAANGWKVEKSVNEYSIITNGEPIKLNLVKEHTDGIDVSYSSLFKIYPELRIKDMRWRAFHSGSSKVEEVNLIELVYSGTGTDILSSLIDMHSKDLTDDGLFAITQKEVKDNYNISDPDRNRYEYFNVKKKIVGQNPSRINSAFFQFKSTQSSMGVGIANPLFPMVANGLNGRLFNNSLNYYSVNPIGLCVGIAHKNNQNISMCLNGSTIFITQSTNTIFTHSSGSTYENLNTVVVKSTYPISQFTGTDVNNVLLDSRFFLNNNRLYVFAQFQNNTCRYFEVNLDNYTVKALNGSAYDNLIKMPFKSQYLLYMPNDRIGEMIYADKNGISINRNGSITSISSPQIKQETSVSSLYYSNNKIWQLLFDANKCYLISKSL